MGNRARLTAVQWLPTRRAVPFLRQSEEEHVQREREKLWFFYPYLISMCCLYLELRAHSRVVFIPGGALQKIHGNKKKGDAVVQETQQAILQPTVVDVFLLQCFAVHTFTFIRKKDFHACIQWTV